METSDKIILVVFGMLATLAFFHWLNESAKRWSKDEQNWKDKNYGE